MEKKIAIIASRFHADIVEKLVIGAQEALLERGIREKQVALWYVPGALEIPIACLHVARTQDYAGIIAIGVVMRGETAHFDYVAGPCAQGVMQVQLQTGIPITVALLTVDNREQAMARAGGAVGNKGAEAAEGLLELIELLGGIK